MAYKMNRSSEYQPIERQLHHQPLTAWWSLDEENTVDDDSDDERETEVKKVRWMRRKKNTDLILAVLDSDSSKVKRMLSTGASPLVRCQHSMATVCHLAALRGEVEILKALAGSGEEGRQALAARDAAGRQPHHLAAAAAQLQTLKLILTLQPSLIDSQAVIVDLKECVKEEQLDSYLHDHMEVTRMLKTVTVGSTALHIASKHSYIDVVEYLLGKKAEVNVKDKDGLSPLDVAGMYADPTVPGTIVSAAEPACFSPVSEADSELLDGTLATDQAEVPNRLHQNFTEESAPFGTQSTFRLESSLRSRKRQVSDKAANPTINVVSSLIKGGGKLSHARGGFCTTPLHRFVEKADMEALEDFVSRQSTASGELSSEELSKMVRAPDGLGRTPVHLAAELCLVEPLKLLLTVDSTAVNLTDLNGRTPLHTAVHYEWTAIIEILLEEKADLKIQNNDGENVLHIAAKKKNPEILKTLLARASKSVLNQRDNQGFTPLFRATEKRDVQSVELLLDVGRPRKYIPATNDSLIHIAVKSNAVNVLRVFSKRMNFDYQHYNSLNKKGCSPLHVAVEEDSVLCLEYLLDTEKVNLSLERADEEGGTALHIAAQRGRAKAMEILLSRLEQQHSRELIATKDRRGREPLVLAANQSHTECVMLLLKHGANLAARSYTSGDRSAIDLIYYNIPNAVGLLGDLMDNFMTLTTKEKRWDSPDVEVKLDYTCLLADRKPDHRQLGVIESFLMCKSDLLRKTLFLHPLTESFLRFKWKQLALFFRILVTIFFVHLIALTAYSMCTYVYEESYVCRYAWISGATVWLFMLPIFILEMMMFRLDKSYMLDSETWVKWLVLFLSAATVYPEIPAEWGRFAAALAVLFAWLQLLFLAAREEDWGLIVLMFLEVVTNVIQVLYTFLFLLLGFAFSFLILFKKKHPFQGIVETMSKVLVMMVELDYAGVYGDDEIDEPGHAIMGRLLYLSFVILVVMVLNNLIVGMSVSDVAELEAQGRSRRMAKQASFLVLFEKICYTTAMPELAHDYIKTYRPAPADTTVFPNKKVPKEMNPLPGELRSRILQTILDRDDAEEGANMGRWVSTMEEEVRQLRKAVNEIREVICQQRNSYEE